MRSDSATGKALRGGGQSREGENIPNATLEVKMLRITKTQGTCHLLVLNTEISHGKISLNIVISEKMTN